MGLDQRLSAQSLSVRTVTHNWLASVVRATSSGSPLWPACSKPFDGNPRIQLFSTFASTREPSSHHSKVRRNHRTSAPWVVLHLSWAVQKIVHFWWPLVDPAFAEEPETKEDIFEWILQNFSSIFKPSSNFTSSYKIYTARIILSSKFAIQWSLTYEHTHIYIYPDRDPSDHWQLGFHDPQ